jgi:hypothetical protein
VILNNKIRVYYPIIVADPGPGALLAPGSGMEKNLDQGSGMNIPNNTGISESLNTIVWVKNT